MRYTPKPPSREPSNAGGLTIPVGYDPGLLSDALAAQGHLGSVGGGFFIGGGYFPAL